MAASTEEDLLLAIDRTPIIDNHAHPLLTSNHINEFPLLSVATEASGDALASSRTSLAHIRAVNQLSRILGCGPTWDDVAAAIDVKRQGDKSEAWVRHCLDGIETILVDDGLGNPGQAESYQYFDQFTRSKCKRIVRIEYEATLIIQNVLNKDMSAARLWQSIVLTFDECIRKCIDDPEVVGFKSVICYRTGLDIGPQAGHEDKAADSFAELYNSKVHDAEFSFDRLAHRGMNEYFVHRLAQLIQQDRTSRKKPIQFHTGLGDNDIHLTTSNPSYLQPFIRDYPDVPIVLLHASYPFTREAGYLAAMYPHVYADIGEVFPFVSRDGQLGIVRQILELCPSSKILWSTDGHFFPETYLLAVDQMREALKTVLSSFIRAGDLSQAQAVQLVEDVLFNNSNKLYNLGLTMERRANTTVGHIPRGLVPDAFARIEREETIVQFLRVAWIDMTSTSRLRLLPMRRVRALLAENEPVSFRVVSEALGLLQNDIPFEGMAPVGERMMVPDWSTLRSGPRSGHAVVRADLQELNGEDVGICPRTTLKRVLNVAATHGLQFVLGFEIELLLLRPTGDDFKLTEANGHAWCVAKAMDSEAGLAMEAAVLQLDKAGIYVEVLHPESAHGAFEIVLPRKPALEAVDQLLYAREVIANCAAAKGYKMTLHPKPILDQGGIASHVHISICSPGGDKPQLYEPFYAGILKHLRAILAFTCSSIASYDRIQDGCWAGGTWVTWGTQNRETQLRKISGSHWEVKCMDGTANPYLAIAALLGAGVHGIVTGEKMVVGDCGTKDSAALSEEERAALGITDKIPESLEEAMEALKDDGAMVKIMGKELVELYGKVKKAEMEFQGRMAAEERRRWMLERY